MFALILDFVVTSSIFTRFCYFLQHIEDIIEHFISASSYFEKRVNEGEKLKKKYFNFRILMFFELKCISGESPILADLKYVICFPSAPLVFEKMNCFWTQVWNFLHNRVVSRYVENRGYISQT